MKGKSKASLIVACCYCQNDRLIKYLLFTGFKHTFGMLGCCVISRSYVSPEGNSSLTKACCEDLLANGLDSPPPSSEGAICNFGSELPAGSASCSHSTPSREIQLFASSLGSLSPSAEAARQKQRFSTAGSILCPFPAFPSCLATSSSCTWRLIDSCGDFWDSRNQDTFCLGCFH